MLGLPSSEYPPDHDALDGGDETQNEPASSLTAGNLRILHTRCLSVLEEKRDHKIRITVNTMGGQPIGLAGLGSPAEDLNFPPDFTIGAALRSPHWVRFATEEERSLTRTRLHALESCPTALIHKGGIRGVPHDFMGLWGTTLTAHFGELTPHFVHTQCFPELETIETPRTPPPDTPRTPPPLSFHQADLTSDLDSIQTSDTSSTQSSLT